MAGRWTSRSAAATAGHTNDPSGSKAVVFQLNADGTLDTGFNGSGFSAVTTAG